MPQNPQAQGSFFGEPIPPDTFEDAFLHAQECDLIFVVGTSAQVYPAADLPYRVAERGGRVVEINLEKTNLSTGLNTLFLKGSASRLLSQLLVLVKGGLL